MESRLDWLEQARAALDDAPRLSQLLDGVSSDLMFDLLDDLKSADRWPRLLAAAAPDLKRRLDPWTPRTTLGRPLSCEAFCEIANRVLRERFSDVPAFTSRGLTLETIGFCAQGGQLAFSNASWRVVVSIEMAEVGPAEAIHEETWLVSARSATQWLLFVCDASDPRRTAAWVQALPLDAHPFRFTEAKQR